MVGLRSMRMRVGLGGRHLHRSVRPLRLRATKCRPLCHSVPSPSATPAHSRLCGRAHASSMNPGRSLPFASIGRSRRPGDPGYFEPRVVCYVCYVCQAEPEPSRCARLPRSDVRRVRCRSHHHLRAPEVAQLHLRRFAVCAVLHRRAGYGWRSTEEVVNTDASRLMQRDCVAWMRNLDDGVYRKVRMTAPYMCLDQ